MCEVTAWWSSDRAESVAGVSVRKQPAEPHVLTVNALNGCFSFLLFR